MCRCVRYIPASVPYERPSVAPKSNPKYFILEYSSTFQKANGALKDGQTSCQKHTIFFPIWYHKKSNSKSKFLKEF